MCTDEDNRICRVVSYCEGLFAGTEQAVSVNDCLERCQARENCNWYVYEFNSQACIFNRDCEVWDFSQKTSISGQSNCSSQFGE